MKRKKRPTAESSPNDWSLAGILHRYFGCEKPFRVRPKVVGYHDEDPSSPIYEYMTKDGNEAYAKLTELLYALEKLGALEDANEVVETLDGIVSDGGY